MKYELLEALISHIDFCCTKIKFGKLTVEFTLHDSDIRSYELIYHEKYKVDNQNE